MDKGSILRYLFKGKWDKMQKTVQMVNKLFRIWCVFMSHRGRKRNLTAPVGKPQTLWINSIPFAVLIMANTKVYQSGCEGLSSFFFFHLYLVWVVLGSFRGGGKIFCFPVREGSGNWVRSETKTGFRHLLGPTFPSVGRMIRWELYFI